MPVVSLDVGKYRLHFTAYNPRDHLSLLYCEYALGRLREALAGVSDADVRGWLEEHRPDTRELFRLLDEGRELPPLTPIGQYPVDPRNAEQELRIITHLRKERIAQGVMRGAKV